MNDIYKNYSNWKDWNKENFGDLTPQKEIYFKNLLKDIKLSNHFKICEIGFGNGELLSYLYKNGAPAYGVEIQDNLINLASKKGIPVKKKIDEFLGIDFDIVILLDVLEHIPNENIVNFLQTIKNKIKKDGLIIARFPNGDSPYSMENQNGDLTHINYIGNHKIRSVSSQLNLEVVKIIGEPVIFFQNDGTINLMKRIIAAGIRFFIRKFMNKIMLLPVNKNYYSSNLIAILRK